MRIVETYIVECCAVFRRLNDLDSRFVADVDSDIGGQRHLRQTKCTRVWVIGRAGDLKRRHDGVAHVLGHRTETDIDINQGSRVTREPAGLNGDCSTANGPFGAVGGRGHASA